MNAALAPQPQRAGRQPAVDDLRRLFEVRSDGALVRRVACGSNGPAGAVAGCLDVRGYVQIEVLGYPTKGHRVVYAITHGRWPEGDVDHIDGDRANNRPANLREVTNSLNQQNLRSARSHNRTGLLGVSPGRRGKFRATIVVNKKQRHLGEFATAQLAHEAYLAAKRDLHPGGTL